MSELFREVLTWWLIFFFLGTLAMPFTTHLFKTFIDKGYIYSKIIGLILITYFMYVLGTVHVLPFTLFSLYVIIGIVSLCSGFFYYRNRKTYTLGQSWKIILLEEVLFFSGIFFWSYIKGFQPDIHGLEKFMDYGFINSILRSAYFPPKDMWMTPLSINYYYFGHLMTTVVTKLSFLPSNITFNLMLATLFSFTLTEGFSLGANFIYLLKKQMKKTPYFYQVLIGGIITGALLTFGGNLHTLYTLFTPYQNDSPVPPNQLTFSPQTFPNSYWYPNATRFIYHTIHEFPIYSFVVSDLHGHVLDIPAVLLMIAVLLVIFLMEIKKDEQLFFKALLLGSLSSILYMTNAWDGLIYVGIASCIIFMKSFSKNIIQTVFSKRFLFSLGMLLVSFILIGLPFSIFFKPFASQIGINCAPQFLLNIGSIGPIIFEQGYCQISPLWQLGILYGFFFFWFVSFIAFLIKQQKRNESIYSIDLFVVCLGFVGFLLIITPEFVYLKDIYTTYFRANTMFKLVYQAFILLSLLSGYTIYRIFTAIRTTKKKLLQKFFLFFYVIFATILITLVLIYPYFAITSYFNNLKDFTGINGITYLQNISKDDYNAVLWINQHIKRQPVMLEAQGDSYTDYERISSNTGLPTVFGWMVHEWLWRGTYDIVPSRIADVTMLYESKDIGQTKNLLRKYSVQYVYVGDMERTKYPHIDEVKFNKLGKTIYTSGSVKIYKIND